VTGDRTVTQDSRATCETLEQEERVAYICAAYQDREGEGLQDSGQLPHIAEQDVRWPQRPPAC